MTAKIIKLRSAKKSLRKIAPEVGVSIAIVHRELKKVA
jgi:IS30 family transposase